MCILFIAFICNFRVNFWIWRQHHVIFKRHYKIANLGQVFSTATLLSFGPGISLLWKTALRSVSCWVRCWSLPNKHCSHLPPFLPTLPCFIYDNQNCLQILPKGLYHFQHHQWGENVFLTGNVWYQTSEFLTISWGREWNLGIISICFSFIMRGWHLIIEALLFTWKHYKEHFVFDSLFLLCICLSLLIQETFIYERDYFFAI